MLFRKNFKQTIRLLLLNVYTTKSVLTVFIHKMYDNCFFFESLLSRFEQKKLIENENEFEL